MSSPIDKQELLAKLHQLPSLPLIVQEVIASFNDADVDTTSLTRKIAQDQGLSAKVLRVANSPFYGLPRKVGSIQEAITILGFDCVRSLVLSASVAKTFAGAPNSTFDRLAYWQRCFRVAAYSKALAGCLRVDQKMAFTAGMFHDIGLLVLDLCIPEQFAALLQRQATSNLPLIEIEQASLGFDHAEVGAEVIRRWNFPQEIEQVTRHWQQPELQTTFAPLVCIVHAAALLENGVSGDELVAKLAATWCGRLPITWERIEACLPQPEQLDAASSLAQTS